MTDVATALRLQSWFSPAFPIGAFSYSHGLETAIEAGVVHDRETLTAWTDSLLRYGSGRTDATFFSTAWRSSPDAGAAATLAVEAAAWVPTAELLIESQHQGDAFLTTVRSAWPDPALDAFLEALPLRPILAVAAGFVAGAYKAPLDYALPLFLQAYAANIVSAGVRIIPLGQTDGQKSVAALEAAVKAAADEPAAIGDLWTATPAHEIYSMQHETQYARIFRS
ncbi:MAG: urease accessory protein UreF [Alphaproteobacteria bacterium]